MWYYVLGNLLIELDTSHELYMAADNMGDDTALIDTDA